MKTEEEIQKALDKYGDMVRRVCFIHLKNHADTQDVFQEVFLKYILYEKEFESDAHEKAWLIRVAVNQCKDLLKSFFRKNVSSLEEIGAEPFFFEKEDSEVLSAVKRLPEKYRTVVYLFYFEGYTAKEIAGILSKNENTIYTWLSRSKAKLKEDLGGEF